MRWNSEEGAETDRLSEYDIKLMDIDQEHLAIPETEYAATVEKEISTAGLRSLCRASVSPRWESHLPDSDSALRSKSRRTNLFRSRD
jgi:hypothetical protein